MHEYTITRSIINISIEEAKKNNAKSITEIRLEVGELTGLVPDALQIYFDMISQGTLAQGAKLIIKKIPIKFKCRKCLIENEVKGGIYRCPICDSRDIFITAGNEYMIDSLEVE